jgi:sugar phosphate permease
MNATRVARVTVTLLFVAWLIDYIDRLVISLALPDIGHTFHLNPVELGGIMSAFSITYALFQIPGGLIGDKFGARKVMAVALTFWSIFTALTGLVGSYVGLLFVRGLFGISEGMFPSASMKAIAERVEAKKRVTANSLMLSSNSLGAALAPLIAAPAIALVGWRHSFFIVTALGIIMAIVLLAALPKTTGATTQQESNSIVETAGTEEGVGSKASTIFKSGLIWKFALMFGTFDIVIWGLLAWVPSYLVNARHEHLVTTGILTSIPWFAGTIGTILGGWMFDKYFHQHFRRLVVTCEVIGIIFLILMTRASTVGSYVTYLTFGLFFIQMCFLPIFGLPVRLLSPKVMASGGSIVNFGGQAGGFLAPILMGFLIQHWSYNAGFILLIVAIAISALTAFWIPESEERFRAKIESTENNIVDSAS